MSYIPNEIKTAWKEASQSFNAASGGLGVSCTLTFDADIRVNNTVITDTASSKPRFLPPAGGMSRPSQVPGYAEQSLSPSSGFYQAEITKTIEGRIYGGHSEFMKNFNSLGTVQSSDNVWKFVCDKKYIPDLMRASYATFYPGSTKEFKSKLLRPPQSYGLGQDVSCISYWIVAKT